MPGLLRGVARTAAVAGTATAVSNGVSRRQAGRWAEQERRQAYEAQAARAGYAEPRPAVPPAHGEALVRYEDQAAHDAPASAREPGADDMNARIEQLRQLGELRSQGILTEAEFETQKARLLS